MTLAELVLLLMLETDDPRMVAAIKRKLDWQRAYDEWQAIPRQGRLV